MVAMHWHSFGKRCCCFYQLLSARWRQHHLTYAAAALTFTSLLSIVPLFAVGFALLRAFPAFQHLSQAVLHFIFSQFVPESGQVIQSYLNDFLAQSHQLTLIGSLFLLASALITLSTVERVFNHIWQVRQARRGVSAFVAYWSVLTLSPLMLGVALALTSYLISLPLLSESAKQLGMSQLLFSAVPLLLETAAFTFLYMVVPNCRVPLRYAVAAALIIAVLFELSKRLFAAYVTSFPTYQLLYGALATLPLFLLWVYISWMLILFGALLNQLMTYRQTKWLGQSSLLQAIAWLQALKAQPGHQASSAKLPTISLAVIEQMQQQQWVASLHSGEFLLTNYFQQITVAQLLEAFAAPLPDLSQQAGLAGLSACFVAAKTQQQQSLSVLLFALI